MAARALTIRDLCWRILAAGDLETKLTGPGQRLTDARPGPATRIARPARRAGLALAGGAPPLPPLDALGDDAARARCLARFAHHELMAVELFAWALLRWPALPGGLRRGLLGVLLDEQRHCRLYLARLEALGSSLSDHECSDYFWRQLPAIDASPHGPRAFLCAMGLTLEQANLDFTLLYRDAFQKAGDEASARVIQHVHEDEVRHVAIAASWLRQLGTPGRSDVELYEEAVPFPLSAARAKARRFDVRARRRAGLQDEFIEHVRRARSSSERRPGRGVRSGTGVDS